MKAVIKTTIFAVAIFLAFLIIKQGMANYFADEEEHKASISDLEQAVDWNSKHAYALARLADHYLLEGDYNRAKDLSFHSLKNNPTYGLPAALIIKAAEKSKDHQVAKHAIRMAAQLWPSHSRTHIIIANYWIEKGEVSKVLPEWDIILSRNYKLRKQLFPILFKLTQTPNTLELLTPYAQKPTLWWPSFFIYLSRQSNNLDSLQWLYNIRIKSDTPLSDNERRHYIERLIKEKKWMTAYFAWLSGLEDKDKQYLQSKLFNGGFESDLHNTGFDWYYRPNKIVKIKQEITRGMSGRSALHISFQKRKRFNFQHVHQRLLLPAGAYSVKLRSRIDHLKTNKGLIWRVRCLGEPSKILGESHALLGSAAWKESSFNFNIPTNNNDCEAQILLLEAASKYAHNHVFYGDIWFDDIKIQALENTNPAMQGNVKEEASVEISNNKEGANEK